MPLDGGLTPKSASTGSLRISFPGDVCFFASRNAQGRIFKRVSDAHDRPPTHPNLRNRSAVVIVREFPPIAIAPPGNSRCGRQGSAGMASAIVPPKARCSVIGDRRRCLRHIVVCDMPGHKSYSRLSSAAVRHRQPRSHNKKAPENRGLSQTHSKTEPAIIRERSVV